MTAWTLGLGLIGLFSVWTAYVFYQWRRVQSLAGDVYRARLEQQELKPNVNLEAFREAFIRAEGPRLTTYFLVTGVISVIALPLLIFVFNEVWHEIWNLTGRVPWFERGELVHAFMLIFVYGAIFFGVAWFTMQRYHRNAPPSLKSEIRRLNGETI